MIWLECPRCLGESGYNHEACAGKGGVYECEHCGHTEEEQHEDCPCCGRPDEDMRDERLKSEADEGNAESAAELYAVQSGDHDKPALRAAFLAGARWVEGGAL